MRAYVLLAIALIFMVFSRSASAAEAGDAARDDESPSRPHLLLQASAGPAFGRLYDIPFWAGEGSAGLGFRLPKAAFVFEGHYARGASNEGLGAGWGGLRTTALFTPGRLRVGGGFDILYFSISRASSGGSIGKLGAGLFAHVGFDVVRFDHGGIEIAMLPEASVLGHSAFYSDSLVAVAHW